MNSDTLTPAYLISSVNTFKSTAIPSRVIALDSNQFTVGRSCDTNFCINSPVISRFHALFVHKNQWTLSDNKSLNGVFVNGVKLEPHEPKTLQEGDTVCFGIITTEEEFSFTFTTKLSNEEATAAKKRKIESQPGSTKTTAVERKSGGGDDARLLEEKIRKSEAVSGTKDLIYGDIAQNENISSVEENRVNSLISDDKRLKLTETESGKKAIPLKSCKSDDLSRVLKKDLECCICSEVIIKAIVLNCSHSFCLHCIEQWKMKKAECPVCRALITSQASSVLLDSVVSNLVDTWDPERKLARQQLIQRRNKTMMLNSKANNACKKRLSSRF